MGDGAVASGAAPSRVVSLVPSLTETLLAWGVVPIACTRFCEQPNIARVGGTKDPDIAGILALAPDIVVMDREENRREDAEALAAAGVRVHDTHVRSVSDVIAEMKQLREMLDLEPLPHSAIEAASAVEKRTAFVAIWRRPWMTCSGATYGSSMLASIGVDNVCATSEQTYPAVTLEDVVALAPQMVLLPSEPYPFRARHAAEIAAALPDADIRLIDGQDLFWWGARTSAARQRLAQALATGW